MGWLNVLQAHKELGLELPVNLKFCFEGMEESGSEGLDELIHSEVGKGKFFEGVDAVCIVRFSPFMYFHLLAQVHSSLTTTGLIPRLHA